MRTQAYSQRHLITIGEVASAIAIARGTAGLEELRWLAQQAANGLLTAPLYPPHEPWQHADDASRIGTPATNPAGIWRTLGAKAVLAHKSAKDTFNYPTVASTWHLLAADVYALAQQPIWSTRAAAALRDLACRYSPDLLDEGPAPAPEAQQHEPVTVQVLPEQPDTAEHVPVVNSASNAPPPKATAKRRSWLDVSAPYIVEVMQAGRYTTAKELYRALEAKAGPNSPFDKGTGAGRGSLFVREIAQSLSLKTVQNNWLKLLDRAKK